MRRTSMSSSVAHQLQDRSTLPQMAQRHGCRLPGARIRRRVAGAQRRRVEPGPEAEAALVEGLLGRGWMVFQLPSTPWVPRTWRPFKG